MKALIITNQPSTTTMLRHFLADLDLEVLVATDGQQALPILAAEEPGIVITDWELGALSGPEICRRIRSHPSLLNTHILVVSTKVESDFLMEALAAGANELLHKPVHKGELQARVKAGMRQIELADQLEKLNRETKQAYAKLTSAHRKIFQEMEQAAQMQKAMLPKQTSVLAGLAYSWQYLPSTMLAGDTLDCFQLDDHNVGFYLLDVSGHGTAAAMFSMMVRNVLTPRPSSDGTLRTISGGPKGILQELNKRFQTTVSNMQYFTIVYGVLDTRTGELELANAGHPEPILVDEKGRLELVEEGGCPVGLVPGAEYETVSLKLEPGQKLILYSDGVTECENREGVQFGQDRFREAILCNQENQVEKLLSEVAGRLNQWSGEDKFEDDLSLLALEWSGSTTGE